MNNNNLNNNNKQSPLPKTFAPPPPPPPPPNAYQVAPTWQTPAVPFLTNPSQASTSTSSFAPPPPAANGSIRTTINNIAVLGPELDEAVAQFMVKSSSILSEKEIIITSSRGGESIQEEAVPNLNMNTVGTTVELPRGGVEAREGGDDMYGAMEQYAYSYERGRDELDEVEDYGYHAEIVVPTPASASARAGIDTSSVIEFPTTTTSPTKKSNNGRPKSTTQRVKGYANDPELEEDTLASNTTTTTSRRQSLQAQIPIASTSSNINASNGFRPPPSRASFSSNTPISLPTVSSAKAKPATKVSAAATATTKNGGAAKSKAAAAAANLASSSSATAPLLAAGGGGESAILEKYSYADNYTPNYEPNSSLIPKGAKANYASASEDEEEEKEVVKGGNNKKKTTTTEKKGVKEVVKVVQVPLEEEEEQGEEEEEEEEASEEESEDFDSDDADDFSPPPPTKRQRAVRLSNAAAAAAGGRGRPLPLSLSTVAPKRGLKRRSSTNSNGGGNYTPGSSSGRNLPGRIGSSHNPSNPLLTNDASSSSSNSAFNPIIKRTEIVAVEDDPTVKPYGCYYPSCLLAMENARKISRELELKEIETNSFRTIRELREHCGLHRRKGETCSDTPFRCSLDPCGKTFKSLAGLRWHFQNASANGHFFVSTEEGEDRPSKKFKTCVTSSGRVEKCPVKDCAKAFKQAAGLAYHLAHAPKHVITENMLVGYSITLTSKTKWWYAKLGKIMEADDGLLYDAPDYGDAAEDGEGGEEGEGEGEGGEEEDAEGEVEMDADADAEGESEVGLIGKGIASAGEGEIDIDVEMK